MELAALSLLIIKVLGSVDLTLIVILQRAGSHINKSQKRLVGDVCKSGEGSTFLQSGLSRIVTDFSPLWNDVAIPSGTRCRAEGEDVDCQPKILFLFEISELRN